MSVSRCLLLVPLQAVRCVRSISSDDVHDRAVCGAKKWGGDTTKQTPIIPSNASHFEDVFSFFLCAVQHVCVPSIPPARARPRVVKGHAGSYHVPLHMTGCVWQQPAVDFMMCGPSTAETAVSKNSRGGLVHREA